MKYLVASGSRKVDLGISEFKSGIKGKELDAVIDSIHESKWTKGEELTIKLDIQADAIEDVWIYDESGTRLKFSGTMISSEGNQASITKMYDTKIPERGRVIVSVYEQPQKFEIPFRIESISLLGHTLQ